ncbi:ABC transporter ATP-binding protein [Ktedonosporobacter rubrisoli]|uniref:ABC transporter ATP-binding protein n=1 Tax=Ktedonosporobacter rubrisoli TaxID=2509675 RepID=A0A4P6JYJ4_KTERU|nr:ABC transporter ATP-binding protein [Ktedonosporobacter rubrisoli]QBD80797.1 ABC transporter ATP-binding protein [Ktedonosporobacter rubrisoli]
MTHTSIEETDRPALLEIKEVDAFYGAAQALDKLSLRINEGEIVCLLGGNASGKSTTMKIILGLLKPRAGEVLLSGRSTLRLPTPQIIRRGVASVPEARRVFSEMTIEENLYVGAYVRGAPTERKQDLQRMYELFPRLGERRRQKAGTLSGGEQQMLAFARALMSHPRLICMDEPTMGLAPIVVERVLDTISEINRLGVTIFMVEQNAELALSIATRGYVLQSGKLVLEGKASDLLHNPAIREAYLGQRVQRVDTTSDPTPS